MSDLERLEAILRQVVAKARRLPWETTWEKALIDIADQLAALDNGPAMFGSAKSGEKTP